MRTTKLKGAKIHSLIIAVAVFLAGCSFGLDLNVPPPVVSDDTVYFYSICGLNAVDAESGKLKWKVKTADGKDDDHCKE